MQLKKLSVSPYLLLGMTVLFWAGNFILGRGLHEQVPPVALSFWRWLTALVLLLPFTLRPMLRERKIIFRSLRQLFLFSLLGVTGFSTLVYTGLKTTTATNGVLLNTTSPVVIILASGVFLKHRLSLRQLLGVVLALLGAAAVITGGNWNLLLKFQLHRGDVFILAAVLCWSMYTVYLRMRPPELAPLAFMGVTVLIGTMMILPVFLWERGTGAVTLVTPAVLAGIFYLALFPSILAYIFWNHAVGQVGANRAGLFLYLMPLFGVLLASLFLGEAIRGFHIAGMVLTLAGIYLTHRQNPILTSPKGGVD